jgi:hypothetical protein
MKYPTSITTKDTTANMCTWNIEKQKDIAGPFKVLDVKGTANPDIFVLNCQCRNGEHVNISHRPRDLVAVRHEFGTECDVEDWGWIDLQQIGGTNRYRVIAADQQVEEQVIVQ